MEKFRFEKDRMVFGDICEGWTPANWAKELRRKAECCVADHPDTARYYLNWAADIERRLNPKPDPRRRQ